MFSREILNFLVRKDARKILKRKDSDAGERGNFGFLISWVSITSRYFFVSISIFFLLANQFRKSVRRVACLFVQQISFP